MKLADYEAKEGFELIAVEKRTFDALIAALDYAHRKGYLPDAMVEEWEEFDFVRIENA